MTLETQVFVILELSLAAFLGMVLGIERERRHSPAGMRTHMLVAVGSCLFTALSFAAFPGSDTSRVAAQIVTGIGFLGAGTIIRERGDVHELTTAASIWATAAIGMAVGARAWLLALGGTIVIWFILSVIRRFEPKKKEVEEAAESAVKNQRY